MISDEIISKVEKELVIKEGACGICHLTLKILSEYGGKAVSMERPDGIIAQVIDSQGEVLGEGLDIVWPPAILKAQISADLVPQKTAKDLLEILTTDKDRKKVSAMNGYGRVISPAGTVLSRVWGEGGRVEIRREGIGIAAFLYDHDDELISDAISAFCPVCAINVAASRNKELFNEVKDKHQDTNNTGKLKYERRIENVAGWSRRRIFVHLKEEDEIIGSNFGCCTSYATVRAEIAAGFGNPAMNTAFNHYCDMCPVKCFWLDKSMGAMGNIILHGMKKAGVQENVTFQDYITAHLVDGNKMVAQGIGSLCSLSATVNAFLRADAVEILKPPSAKGFPKK
ncbi:MAG: hypothetical protein LLF83_07090 [Methanobacterium sp.]|nr:hypothetical protein [Methanobacterium sp.]